MNKSDLNQIILQCKDFANDKQYQKLYELIEKQPREINIILQDIFKISYNFKNLIYDSSKIELILDILKIIE